jgi:hypothetical protein
MAHYGFFSYPSEFIVVNHPPTLHLADFQIGSHHEKLQTCFVSISRN